MLPPGELWCDAGRRIRTGRAWRDQCVAARSLTDPLFSVLDGFRVILNSQRTIDESFDSSFYLDLFVFLFDVLLFAFYILICCLSWYDVAALPPGASSAWPSHCAHCGSLSLENPSSVSIAMTIAGARHKVAAVVLCQALREFVDKHPTLVARRALLVVIEPFALARMSKHAGRLRSCSRAFTTSLFAALVTPKANSSPATFKHCVSLTNDAPKLKLCVSLTNDAPNEGIDGASS